MGVILHQNSLGIKMVREDFNDYSEVNVIIENEMGRYCHRSYRFNHIQDTFDSPFVSWANLDCCGGWQCDEEYLTTAVQEGRKLFAGIATPLKGKYLPNYPTKAMAKRQFEALRSTFPPEILGDYEELRVSPKYLYTFICRRGKIADYINLDTVFSFYEKLGVNIPGEVKTEVRRYCDFEISTFGTKSAPFDYSNAEFGEELITTGLLLGYPIESTASILQGY